MRIVHLFSQSVPSFINLLADFISYLQTIVHSCTCVHFTDTDVLFNEYESHWYSAVGAESQYECLTSLLLMYANNCQKQLLHSTTENTFTLEGYTVP